ncbi:LPXTG cell wall anchor domain-containing protein [Asanoa sp. NPDC049573]|uniref:LPXTG cell wall anchor domain-containing protein n=1 Tax=Asanoa sp. NPDC049573 TaxID=3155396 RepID=UPI00341B3660
MSLLRTAVALGAAAVTLGLTGAAASAVDITTPVGGATASGDEVLVTGTAARPGSTVVVTAAAGTGPDIDVASCDAPVGDAGTWSCALTGLAPGSWTLNAAGTNPDGAAETTPLRGFRVGPGAQADAPPALATTGDALNTPLATAGAALLALGAGLFYRGRRRA